MIGIKQARKAAEADPAQHWRLVFFERDLQRICYGVASDTLLRAVKKREGLERDPQRALYRAAGLSSARVDRLFEYWRGQRSDLPPPNPQLVKAFTQEELQKLDKALERATYNYIKRWREKAQKMIELADKSETSVERMFAADENADDVLEAIS